MGLAGSTVTHTKKWGVGVSGVYCHSYLEVGWWGEWGLLSLIFRSGVLG